MAGNTNPNYIIFPPLLLYYCIGSRANWAFTWKLKQGESLAATGHVLSLPLLIAVKSYLIFDGALPGHLLYYAGGCGKHFAWRERLQHEAVCHYCQFSSTANLLYSQQTETNTGQTPYRQHQPKGYTDWPHYYYVNIKTKLENSSRQYAL